MAAQRLGVGTKGGIGFGEQQLASIFAQQFELLSGFATDHLRIRHIFSNCVNCAMR